ncbi:MAG: hypothetical protein AAGF79_08870 [Pseudomonadota bacterium]
MRRLTILAALLAPVMLPAQTIPIPLSDSAETRQISVAVAPGVRSMRQVPSARLRVLRARMHRGEDLPSTALKELANLGDGLAAQRYVRRLLDSPDASPSDIAYYAAIAVGAGRVWTLPDMIDAMRLLDPQSEPWFRIRTYISVLYGHAWRGNTLALDAVEEFNGAGKLFGPLTERTRARMIAQAEKNGDGRLELRMALALLEQGAAQNELPEADVAQLRGLLSQAAAADSLSARAMAENLLTLTEAKYGVK